LEAKSLRCLEAIPGQDALEDVVTLDQDGQEHSANLDRDVLERAANLDQAVREVLVNLDQAQLEVHREQSDEMDDDQEEWERRADHCNTRFLRELMP
jgi:hypothetical protein